MPRWHPAVPAPRGPTPGFPTGAAPPPYSRHRRQRLHHHATTGTRRAKLTKTRYSTPALRAEQPLCLGFARLGGPRSRRWCAILAPASSHPRRRLQPHRRGQPPRPDAALRGIDNAAYYRWPPESRYYVDYTGCGNTQHAPSARLQRSWTACATDPGHARRRLPLDSPRPARELHAVDRLGAFFDIIHQTPSSRRSADRRAVGPRRGGYQVLHFPLGGAESGMQKCGTRPRCRKGEGGMVSGWRPGWPAAAIYDHAAGGPSQRRSGLHDGFNCATRRYSEKHSEANLRATVTASHNSSWNCGVGPDRGGCCAPRAEPDGWSSSRRRADDPRRDEMGRTQQNNNASMAAHRQVAWTRGHGDPPAALLLPGRVAATSCCAPALLPGPQIRGGDIKDITWFEPGGAGSRTVLARRPRPPPQRPAGGGAIDEPPRAHRRRHPVPDVQRRRRAARSRCPLQPSEQWERLLDGVDHWSQRGAVSSPDYPLAGRSVVVRVAAIPPRAPVMTAPVPARPTGRTRCSTSCVKTFCDSDGDSIGDFRGLTGKLDYVSDLGVDACAAADRRRRSATTATTRTTRASIRATARWTTSASSSTPRTSAACG